MAAASHGRHIALLHEVAAVNHGRHFRDLKVAAGSSRHLQYSEVVQHSGSTYSTTQAKVVGTCGQVLFTRVLTPNHTFTTERLFIASGSGGGIASPGFENESRFWRKRVFPPSEKMKMSPQCHIFPFFLIL